MNAEDSYTTATEPERSANLADDVAHSDPLSVRPALKDVLVGLAAMLVPYLLLIGAYLGIKKLDLGGVPSAVLPALVFIALLLPTAFLLLYFKRRDIPLGFRPLGKRGWHLLWQIPASILVAAVCSAVFGALIGVDPGDSSSSGQSDSGSTALLLTLAAYLLIGPLLEEIVFRRLIMGYFDTLMPAAISVFLTSLLFGLAHIALPVVIYTFFAGLAFALATRWHRSLWGGFVLHLSNNLLVQLVVLSSI